MHYQTVSRSGLAIIFSSRAYHAALIILTYFTTQCDCKDPSEFWLSTGLIPQLLAIDFVHDVQLESVTVEAWGIEKISIILEGQSPPPLSRARHLGETSRHLPTLEFSDDLEFELQRVDLRNIHAGACQRVYLRIDGALTDFVAVRKVEVTGRPLISP